MTTEQADSLQALLATHTDVLQRLLPPHLWPVQPFKVEQFGALTKYTLGEAWPDCWVMLHHLSAPDVGPAGPHDHPVRLQSYGIAGGYIERVYPPGSKPLEVARLPGDTHTIYPETIHEIIQVPAAGAWTLYFAGPVVRQWRHYPELLAAA